MTKEIKFPYQMRKNMDTCAIGDEKVKQIAEANGIPFAFINEFEGKSEEKKRQREKFLKKYSYYICCPGYNKAFSLKEILMKKKTHFMCSNSESLPQVYNECKFTYKLKIKDCYIKRTTGEKIQIH